VTFARLSRGDWLAFVAALALLLVMSLDWYSTQAGVDARKDAQSIQPRGATAGEVARALDRSANEAADKAEKNAWQADAFADRLVLFALLATAALAIASAFLRAADAHFRQPWTPAAITTGVGLFAVLLLAARIVQKPSAEIGAVVKAGAPIGLACTGLIVIGARIAWNAEREDPAAAAPDDDTAERPAARAAGPPAPLFDHADPAPEGGAVATAVRPATAERTGGPAADDGPAEPDEDWAPDWSDPAAAEAEPDPAAADRARRRNRGRGRRGKGKRPRRF
jgi:ElaB/YqjD/DUF883 family membrane-anchored ribosome-binding protein